MTSNASKRLHRLRQEFKAKGDSLVEIHACDHIEAAYSVERSLISFCEQRYELHSGREWFRGGDFAVAVEEAIKQTNRWRSHKYPARPTEKELAELRQKYAAEKQERAARRAAWELGRQARSAAWRAKRHRAANAIEQFIAFALKPRTPSPTEPTTI